MVTLNKLLVVTCLYAVSVLGALAQPSETPTLDALMLRPGPRWTDVHSNVDEERRTGYLVSLDAKKWEELSSHTFKVWLRRDYLPPSKIKSTGREYDYTIERVTIECTNGRYRFHQYYWYKNDEVVDEFAPSEETWSDAIPGSVGESVYEKVCDFLELARRSARRSEAKRRH